MIKIRCKSMTFDEYHTIIIPDNDYITCSCQGVNWCSHIEATLVCGERHMVHKDDHILANQAQILYKDKIKAPKDWKSNWRSNKRWRGIPIKIPKALQLLKEGFPVVSFQGSGKSKKEALEIANNNGWKIAKYPSNGVIAHVVLDDKKSSRIDHAENLGIMIIYKNEWPAIAPIGKTLKLRMLDLLNSNK